jgi:D-sedoheptulose 7-phosphate isomerase
MMASPVPLSEGSIPRTIPTNAFLGNSSLAEASARAAPEDRAGTGPPRSLAVHNALEVNLAIFGPTLPEERATGNREHSRQTPKNSVASSCAGGFDRRMTFEKSLADTVLTLESLVKIRPQIDAAGKLITGTLKAGGKLLICGNGGSAAEAAHFATELVGRYDGDRRSLPAIALSSDGSLVTCIGNDHGYDLVFARQIAGLAKPGDLVVAITSSGNSPNIVAALKEAKRLGVKTLAFLGRGGGRAKGIATCELLIPGTRGAPAQEAHLFLIHHFCELIEEKFS